MADRQPTQTGENTAGRARRRRHEARAPRKIRYTSAEWEAIVECAHTCGKAPAEYVRETSLGAMPRARHGRENEAVVHELGRIGTALAALARVAKESGMTTQATALDAALADVVTAVRRLG